MAIGDWFPILNWQDLPNFGYCHTIADLAEFKKSFLETEELSEFRRNFLTTLNGSFDTHQQRILGKPGAGKTTFLYSLMKINGDELSERYFIYPFHINKAKANDPDPYVVDQYLDGLSRYFEDSGFGHEFKSINGQSIDSKHKLNKCARFFLDNKTRFKKVLVVVFDDVDLLPGEMMRGIIEAAISHLETASIKKWLFIREETYDKYDAETKKTLSQFFPEQRTFPRISLFDIVQHRIANTAGGTKPLNPFSRTLCDHVQAIYDDCLRESLSALKTILENSYQKKFHQNQSIEFVQNYLEKAGATSLIKGGRLPNLHLPQYRTVPYPIPIDMLALMNFIQDENLLIGATNHAINARRHKINAQYKDEEIFVNRAQFAYTIESFVRQGLATHRDGTLFLTAVGRAVASYCAKKFYNEACFEVALGVDTLSSNEYTSDYQLMSLVSLDHQEIAKIWTTTTSHH